jgi:sulfur carrier protein ThiS
MKLYAGGYLTFYMPDQQPEMTCELSDPVELCELLMSVGIPAAEVQLVLVNGEIADLKQTQIHNPDVIKVFPGVDGG